MDDAPSPASRPDAAGSTRAGGADRVRLPAESLRRLSRLCGELGAGSVAVLRDAGRAAGRSLVEGFPGAEEPEAMGLERFWRDLRDAAIEAGFGRVQYRVLDADVGQVELRGSPESAPPPGPRVARPRSGCHFAAGWIGGALSAVAGEPVAVLEVRCAAGSDAGACRFLVGPEPRLEEIRASLRAGSGTLEEALEDR